MNARTEAIEAVWEPIGDAVEASTDSAPGALFEAMLNAPLAAPAAAPVLPAATIAVLHGFDLTERALLSGIDALPGELVPARSTVALRRESIGASVVLVFEAGDPRRPIIIGVIDEAPLRMNAPSAAAVLGSPSARIDDGERLVLRAEREVVLQCGDASITLTRAGKVLIKGHYILSRSSGYNKIKGAAIDIN